MPGGNMPNMDMPSGMQRENGGGRSSKGGQGMPNMN